jgi:hypothetical protein
MSNTFFSKFMVVFGFIMVACYIGIALFLLLSPSFKYIDLNMRMVFSFFFIAYGLFRLVRLISKIKNQNYEND